MNLRPIGTRYTERIVPGPMWCSTDVRPRTLTYEVVAHVPCQDGPGAPVETREQVQCVDIAYGDWPTSMDVSDLTRKMTRETP